MDCQPQGQHCVRSACHSSQCPVKAWQRNTCKGYSQGAENVLCSISRSTGYNYFRGHLEMLLLFCFIFVSLFLLLDSKNRFCSSYYFVFKYFICVCPQWSQKGVLGLLELETQASVSCLTWVIGVHSGALQQQQALLTAEMSLQSPFRIWETILLMISSYIVLCEKTLNFQDLSLTSYN